MKPKIIEVKEGTLLGPGNVPVAVLNVRWTYGNFGPFTLQTNWQDLNQGKTMLELQKAAAMLDTLPLT